MGRLVGHVVRLGARPDRGEEMVDGRDFVQDDSAEDREDRQDRQRRHHQHARLVEFVVFPVGLFVVLARMFRLRQEDDADEPGGIERRDARGRQEHEPGHPEGRKTRLLEDRDEDLILRDEAGHEREAGERQRARDEDRGQSGQLLPQPPHLADVLLAVERVDDRAGSEEEQRLEERVRHDVEEARRELLRRDAGEHEAELRDGRVRQDLLDVVLRHRDEAAQQRGRGADQDHEAHHRGRVDVDEVHAGHHVDARRHHRGRMDEGRHRRGAGHRVREPDVKRDLRALAAGADEEEGGSPRGPAVVDLALRHPLEVEGAEHLPEAEDPEQEAEVADAVGDEGLLACVRVLQLLVPEPDQQVGAEPDALPPHEHQQDGIPEDQDQHREHEEVQVREEAREALVLVHVADRVDVDQRADAGDDEKHDGAQRVDREAEGDDEIAGRDPVEELVADRPVVMNLGEGRQ